jgi:formiminoglutamase
MSGASSSAVAWFTRLEPAPRIEDVFRRPDDPRLGDVIVPWDGNPAALTPARAVLLGFPVDEGVRRNHGRPGAALAPHEIRRFLARLTPADPAQDSDLTRVAPLDAGNLRLAGSLEAAQESLGIVVGEMLAAGAVPIILGGGHETAYGHYLGYVAAGKNVGIVNIDAHLDVRPFASGNGNSGTPFRQALEHPTRPLPGNRYVCLGAQPHAVSRSHYHYLQQRGSVVRWCSEIKGSFSQHFTREVERLASAGPVHVTIDADAVQQADVPGVSAPNPVGLAGAEVASCARLAGRSATVSSMDLVEINPEYDRDGQSARWAALLVWNFIMGLAER